MSQAKQTDFDGHEIYRWYVYADGRRFISWGRTPEQVRHKMRTRRDAERFTHCQIVPAEALPFEMVRV